MHTSFPLFPDRSQVQSLFKTLLIKSVIQLELIHAIDNIIFYPTSSRNDDERNMSAVKVSMAKRTERERLHSHEVSLEATKPLVP